MTRGIKFQNLSGTGIDTRLGGTRFALLMVDE